MQSRSLLSQTRFLLAPLLAFALTLALQARAQNQENSDAALKFELDYAQKLQEAGMANYAEMVIQKLPASAGARKKVLELSSLIAVGKFDAVKALIAREPSQQSQDVLAMKLALADGYYAWGKYKEAKAIYEEFFAAYPNQPPEAIAEFYRDSAYKFAQMLILMGDEKGAIAAYQRLLNLKVEKHIRRQILGEMSDLIIKQMTKDPSTQASGKEQIKKINDDLLWVMDVWFGKAIVNTAHLKMMDGDIDGAMKLIDDYESQLLGIDAALAEEEKATTQNLTKLSPMAQCRYLIGVILQKEAEKLIAAGGAEREKAFPLLAGKTVNNKNVGGALQHFYNVFMKYPGTPWAADAGVRGRQVKTILERDFGKKISIEIKPEQTAKVAAFQYQEAHSLYAQNQYAEAETAFLTFLSIFPEEEISIGAIGELFMCYMDMKNETTEWAPIVLSGYLAERFSKNPKLTSKAGEQLVRMAELFGERKDEKKKEATYELFFTYYEKHPLAASALNRFGDKKFEATDMEGALAYYVRVTNSYWNLPVAMDAMNRMGYAYSKLQDFSNEVKVLEILTTRLEQEQKSSPLLPNIKYRLAYAYKTLGPKTLPNAIKLYGELVKTLGGTNAQGKATDLTPETKQILEGAAFYRAMCYALLTEPADKVKDYRLSAIKLYADMVKQFPKSEFAPMALTQIGTLHTILQNPEDAQKAFKQLQSEYAGSKEAKNAIFLQAKALMELGMKDQAIKLYAEMFSDKGGQYTPVQILSAGNELLKSGDSEIALKAFDSVLAGTMKDLHEQATVRKGQALVNLERSEEALNLLQGFLRTYTNSGYTVDACTSIGRACADLGSKEKDTPKRDIYFTNGVAAIVKAKRYLKSDADKAANDLDVARMFELRAKGDEQFGDKVRAKDWRNRAIATYLMQIMANRSEPELRKHLETAYVEAIALLLATERFPDVVEYGTRFLEAFPRSTRNSEVRRSMNQANVKLVVSGKSANVATNLGAEVSADMLPATDTNAPPAGTNDVQTNPGAAAPASPAPATETTTNATAAGQ